MAGAMQRKCADFSFFGEPWPASVAFPEKARGGLAGHAGREFPPRSPVVFAARGRSFRHAGLADEWSASGMETGHLRRLGEKKVAFVWSVTTKRLPLHARYAL